jgi:hypothetical protein
MKREVEERGLTYLNGLRLDKSVPNGTYLITLRVTILPELGPYWTMRFHRFGEKIEYDRRGPIYLHGSVSVKRKIGVRK